MIFYFTLKEFYNVHPMKWIKQTNKLNKSKFRWPAHPLLVHVIFNGWFFFFFSYHKITCRWLRSRIKLILHLCLKKVMQRHFSASVCPTVFPCHLSSHFSNQSFHFHAKVTALTANFLQEIQEKFESVFFFEVRHNYSIKTYLTC